MDHHHPKDQGTPTPTPTHFNKKRRVWDGDINYRNLFPGTGSFNASMTSHHLSSSAAASGLGVLSSSSSNPFLRTHIPDQGTQTHLYRQLRDDNYHHYNRMVDVVEELKDTVATLKERSLRNTSSSSRSSSSSLMDWQRETKGNQKKRKIEEDQEEDDTPPPPPHHHPTPSAPTRLLKPPKHRVFICKNLTEPMEVEGMDVE